MSFLRADNQEHPGDYFTGSFAGLINSDQMFCCQTGML